MQSYFYNCLCKFHYPFPVFENFCLHNVFAYNLNHFKYLKNDLTRDTYRTRVIRTRIAKAEENFSIIVTRDKQAIHETLEELGHF